MELALLARHCAAADRRAPQTWCVVGNCFSLQGEHDAALAFLKRVRGCAHAPAGGRARGAGPPTLATPAADRVVCGCTCVPMLQAVQVDPSFTYAHTLCGHELSAAGEHERALHAFRMALSLDGRHYRAW
jgi:anaphase-promoting complex subunit 3